MSGRGVRAVVTDFLRIQAPSHNRATVKQSLTVRVEPGRGPSTEKSSVLGRQLGDGS
jgi:hypothetical protein